MASSIILHHDFQPKRFHWLWAKYVNGTTAAHHCTNCLRGRYSRRFSAHNPGMFGRTLVLDEQPAGAWGALYLCGVAKRGYPRSNYPHNVHLALVPCPGAEASWTFEDWSVRAENAVLLPIPDEDALPDDLRALPPAFTTCRIFRWAMVAGKPLVGCDHHRPVMRP